MSYSSLNVISPVDRSTHLTRLYAEASEIKSKIDAAEAAVKPWRRTPLGERVALVQRFGEQMKARADALGDTVAWSIGRPRWQVALERVRGGEPRQWIVEGCDAQGRIGLSAALVDRPVATEDRQAAA